MGRFETKTLTAEIRSRREVNAHRGDASRIPPYFLRYAGVVDMSVEQYQRSVNSLDKDIAALEKKKSDVDKKSAELSKKINDTAKSITARTSASMTQSKRRQISGWESDRAKKSAESAELGKKIADKRQKRNEAYLKLQKAQQDEQKKQVRQLKNMQTSYENRIAQLQSLVVPVKSHRDGGNSEDITTDAEYDVFISHAWEDKESFADEFVEELRKRNLCVWYDTSQIKWGDSMRAKIDEGLRKSKFGVVILSPNYIREGKYWTKAELDGLFQLESINGKMLLPVWHNLTKKEVMDYSPIIAGKLAMNTASMTPAEIAEEFAKLLKIEP